MRNYLTIPTENIREKYPQWGGAGTYDSYITDFYEDLKRSIYGCELYEVEHGDPNKPIPNDHATSIRYSNVVVVMSDQAYPIGAVAVESRGYLDDHGISVYSSWIHKERGTNEMRSSANPKRAMQLAKANFRPISNTKAVNEHRSDITSQIARYRMRVRRAAGEAWEMVSDNSKHIDALAAQTRVWVEGGSTVDGDIMSRLTDFLRVYDDTNGRAKKVYHLDYVHVITEPSPRVDVTSIIYNSMKTGWDIQEGVVSYTDVANMPPHLVMAMPTLDMVDKETFVEDLGMRVASNLYYVMRNDA